MNKYLLMCAAAAMATTASGQAARASWTVNFANINGSSSSICDYMIINYSGGGLYAAKHHGAVSCGSSVFDDPGYKAGKSASPFGVKTRSVGFADTALVYSGAPYDALEWVLQTPFGEGSLFSILANTSGSTTFILYAGRQTNKVKPGAKKSAIHDAIVALGLKK